MLGKKKVGWPEPEKSIGKLCSMKSRNGLVWEAVGPAKLAYDQISKQIGDLLLSRSEYLDEGEEYPSTICYGLWMIGRDPAHATPTIVIGCESQSVRTKAEEIIKIEGILVPFPGIAVKKSPCVPRLLAPGRSGMGIGTVFASDQAFRSYGIPAITGSSGTPSLEGRTTVGGLVCVGPQQYGLTVSHAFCSKNQDQLVTHQDFPVLDFDSDDNDTEEEYTVEGTSAGGYFISSGAMCSMMPSSYDLQVASLNAHTNEGDGLMIIQPPATHRLILTRSGRIQLIFSL